LADSASTASTETQPSSPAFPRVGNPVVAVVAALLIPGLGHVYLRRWRRGLAFLVLVAVSLWVGCALKGNLYQVEPNDPLSILATLGAMGMGISYFLLRISGYAGDILSAGYEYGTAFLLTAGLMNWLLVLDAWDISRGKKE